MYLGGLLLRWADAVDYFMSRRGDDHMTYCTSDTLPTPSNFYTCKLAVIHVFKVLV
ncbi:hypothetical protein HBI67_000920 [Parastagonospora nodorum]|nr:hypothetical protein HBI67_000920 [Parastagonospora nodorum]KAH6090518.1 hypothetical protein HBI66_018670 [Parastagonospora nodorum]KAH6318171.1 hypothetical protein HBI39_012160 [Parastagonospora nodorum]